MTLAAYPIMLMLVQKAGKPPEPTPLPMYLPHLMLRAIWQAGPLQQIVSLFGKDEDPLHDLWTPQLHTPFVQQHPALQDLSVIDYMFGLDFHSDGGQVYSNQETLWFSRATFYQAVRHTKARIPHTWCTGKGN